MLPINNLSDKIVFVRQKISSLLKKIKEIEKTASRAANESHRAANEVSGGLVASYSAAGDAEHSRNSANLSIQKAETIKKLLVELEKSLDSDIPKFVQSVCFVSVKFEDGNQKDLYLVENPVFISEFNLISSKSPLGEALVNKKVGSSFSYLSGTKSNVHAFRGSIISIE